MKKAELKVRWRDLDEFSRSVSGYDLPENIVYYREEHKHIYVYDGFRWACTIESRRQPTEEEIEMLINMARVRYAL